MTKILLICELGCNWENLDQAKEMIKATKKAGGDLAKFQIFKEEHVKDHPEFKRLKKLIITEDMAKELFEYGKSIGQEVFFSVFYPEAVDICERVGVKRYKIRTNEKTSIREKVYKETDKPILISIKSPMYWVNGKLTDEEKERYKILFCIPKYPTVIKDYKDSIIWHKLTKLGYSGLSCHCPSITPSLLAVSHGATIIEKHVMSNLYEKDDYPPIEKDWSITFDEFRLMREIIREMEVLI